MDLDFLWYPIVAAIGASLGFMAAALISNGKTSDTINYFREKMTEAHNEAEKWKEYYEKEKARLDEIYKISRVDEHDPDEEDK